MAKKVTKELAEIRGIPAGIDLRSPSRHPDILGADDLVIKIEEFREATGYRLPVSVKLGAGRVRDDIKIAVKDGFDFVELDGMQGSTGAGSGEVIDFVGIPTLAAIMEALDALHDIGRRDDIEIVLMGGLRDGIDAVKALCLGADAAAFGTSVLIAGGCIACMQCHVGQCVTGIATQDPEHEKRYKPHVEAQNIHRFLEGVRWQIAALTHGLGYTDVRALNRDDLVALTPEAAAITRLPYAPGIPHAQPGALGADGLRWAEVGVYDIDRILVPEAPPEIQGRYRRCALRAGPLPGGVSGGYRRALLSRLHLGRQVRGSLRGHHGHQSIQLHLRQGV